MKKVIALSILCLSTVANAEKLAKIKLPSDAEIEAEAYKTTKPTQISYVIHYSNYYDTTGNEEYEVTPDKNGLYSFGWIKLDSSLPKDFVLTNPSINDIALAKMLKINTNEVVAKFKKVSKKQRYSCEIKGKMLAQFRVDYEGGDYLRFPESQVHADIYSATPVGKPVTTCQKS